MKKIFVIMIVVFMVSIIGTCAAEKKDLDNGCDCNYCSGIRMAQKWAETYGYEMNLNEDRDNNTHYYCGMLDRKEWEKDNDKAFTWSAWIENAKEKYELSNIIVKQIGEIEGYDVYQITAQGYDGKNIRYDDRNIEDVIVVVFE